MLAGLLVVLLAVQSRGKPGDEEGEYLVDWPKDVPKVLPVKHFLPFPAGKQFSILKSPHTAPSNRYAIDFAMPMQSPVCASADGVVIKIDESGPNTGGSTNQIILKHADGTLSCYLHLANKGAIVKLGDFVFQGDVIGRSGASGTQVPHTHYSQNKEQALECLQPTFEEGSDPNRWISKNESFAAKYKKDLDLYARAEIALKWGPRFHLWVAALDAKKELAKNKPKDARLRKKYDALAAMADSLEGELEKFLSDPELGYVAYLELKGTSYEDRLKKPSEKLKDVDVRRSALKQAFDKDLKSGDLKGYESFLQRFSSAPESAAVKERLTSGSTRR